MLSAASISDIKSCPPGVSDKTSVLSKAQVGVEEGACGDTVSIMILRT